MQRKGWRELGRAMPSAIKISIAKAILIALTVWPALHFVLAQRFHFDPWKLLSFGMYSVPYLPQQVHAFAGSENTKRRISLRHDPHISTATSQFLVYREVFGTFVTPEALAIEIFKKTSTRDQLEILVLRPYVARDSLRITLERTRFHFRQDDTGKLITEKSR